VILPLGPPPKGEEDLGLSLWSLPCRQKGEIKREEKLDFYENGKIGNTKNIQNLHRRAISENGIWKILFTNE
jgi:hypothetical protein